jgi:hypothetical protein
VTTKESDRYFSPAWLIEATIEQFGAIDLDPCHDPDPACLIKATKVYDIRKGEDGLVLPWAGKVVYLNPPYSSVLPWVIRAAQHAQAGGEVLALINASTDTAAWQSYVLVHGEVCLLSKRVAFGKPGSMKTTPNPMASAVVHFGKNVEAFRRVWSRYGTIVRRVDVPAVAQAAA